MEELHPRDYPWAEPSRAGMLTEAGLVADVLPVDVEGRVPVIAVGSNASSAVLQRKLGPLLATGVPVAAVEVEQLAVGHSAHVSLRGYLPAAPFRGVGSRAALVGWYDADQLAALDASEPNYRRVTLPGDMPCRMGDRHLSGAAVYESVHGVLGEGGSPLDLLTQSAVLAWLARRLPSPLAATLDHRMLTRLDTREQVRVAMRDADLVLPSGL